MITIREYNEKDKAAVIGLLQMNTPAYFSPEEEKDLVHYLGHEIESYYVAEHEGEVVGCGGFNFSDDRATGKISWDIFHPGYQGKGWGTRLLKYRIEILKEREHVKLISVRTSQLVYPFYEKCGFVLREIIKDYWAEGFDLYRMELEDRGGPTES